jgi:hypothetical protein
MGWAGHPKCSHTYSMYAQHDHTSPMTPFTQFEARTPSNCQSMLTSPALSTSPSLLITQPKSLIQPLLTSPDHLLKPCSTTFFIFTYVHNPYFPIPWLGICVFVYSRYNRYMYDTLCLYHATHNTTCTTYGEFSCK